MTRYHNINGKNVAFTAEEETARDTEEANVLAEKTANSYKSKRRNEYPSVVDQLDTIYHSGIDVWKKQIE